MVIEGQLSILYVQGSILSKVFCIAAGQLDVKKEATILNKRNHYLNYGLLSLVSLLNDSGYDAIQIQGNFDAPEVTLSRAVELGILDTSHPVLISLPSFYALTWVNSFTRQLKELLGCKIIVGGRWVVDGQPELLNKALPYVDSVIDGLGERSLQSLFGEFHLSKGIPLLNFDYLDRRHLYQPCFEVSRGCGMKCSFCQESTEKLQPLKCPHKLIQEVKKNILDDGLTRMTPYFEASMFKPTSKWVSELIHEQKREGVNFHWRAETRADVLKPKMLNELARSGLKVLDVGLESADHGQLKKMEKTNNPTKYLERADELIKAASDAGIWIKLNVLLYAGESFQSLNATKEWIHARRHLIKGISAGPVIVFGWPQSQRSFLDQIAKYGATPYLEGKKTGITPLNLSSELDYRSAMEHARALTNELMSPRDLFDLKSFSYYSRDYSWNDYIGDRQSCSLCSRSVQ